MPFEDMDPLARTAVVVLVILLVLRLCALLSEELARPSAPTTAPPTQAEQVDAVLRPPSRFAPPHEHLLYDLGITRTTTELVGAKTSHAQATLALLRASAELEAMIVENTRQPTPARAIPHEPSLARQDLAHLIELLPQADAQFRAEFLALVDAYLEETRR